MPKFSELVITGPEWKGLCEIISIVLGNDDLFRESGKTLLWNRGQVEAARDELNRAAQRGKSWILYVLRDGSDHILTLLRLKAEDSQDTVQGT